MINIKENGQTSIHEDSSESKYKLICNTNINKNIDHQISWMKDENELTIDNVQYSKDWMADSPHANSVLDFKSIQHAKTFNYSGTYKCKIFIRYPEVGQGTYYLSEAKQVEFTYFGNLFWLLYYFFRLKWII